MTTETFYELFRDLDFEGFRRLAAEPDISKFNRIGFPDKYREDFETAIFRDVRHKLPLLEDKGKVILDIGPGCSDLPEFLIDLCRRHGHTLILVDSEEMLGHLPDEHFIHKIAGPYPANASDVGDLADQGVDVILCYSVLQYIFLDFHLDELVGALVALLRPGGQILLGDIPNVSMRKRFFASQKGRAAHREFTGRDEEPTVLINEPEDGKLNDAVLLELITQFRLLGLDAFLLPQAEDLPMASRREDILVRKP